MFVDFNILNQLGSPSINSNTFANRPAAGQTGRLFVSTDTFEIYRDNGTGWDLIGGPGSSTITGTGTATQVAYFTSSQAIGSSANLFWDNTNTRLGIGTSTPGVRLDIHGTGNMLHINSTSATANALMSFQRTGTNVWRLGDQYNGGSNFFELHNTALANNAIQIETATNKSILTSIQSYSTGLARGNYLDYTLSLTNGTTFTSPNTVTALGATLNLNIAGSATIPAGARSGADFFNGINFTSAGTFTVDQSSTIRAFSNVTAGWAFNGSAVGTVTHLAGIRVLFPTNSGSAINVTTNYGLLINDQTANAGTITYTNRWGVYQEGASDLNYLNANLLLGSTTNSGEKLQVTGTAIVSSSLTAASFIPTGNTIPSNGMYLPSTNAVGITTNSVQRLHISSTGSVGIGNNAPVSLLSLAGTFAKNTGNEDTWHLQIRDTTAMTTGVGGGIVLTGNYTTGGAGASIAAVSGYKENSTSGNVAGQLRFYSSDAGGVLQLGALVTSGQNFLIGTTTDAGQKLQVNGNIKIDAGTSTNLITGTVQNGVTALVSTTDPVNSDRIYNLGFGSSNYVSQGRIEVYASENWSATNRGCEFRIRTTPNAGTTPTNRMIVKNGGQVRFVPLAADPAGQEAGDVYYNSGTNKLRLYDGTNWVDLN